MLEAPSQSQPTCTQASVDSTPTCFLPREPGHRLGLALSHPQREPAQGPCPLAGGPPYADPGPAQPGGLLKKLLLQAWRAGVCSQRAGRLEL